jgi:hypothetical protein
MHVKFTQQRPLYLIGSVLGYDLAMTYSCPYVLMAGITMAPEATSQRYLSRQAR